MPKDFEPVNTKEEFNELYLVNTKIPMSIKFSTAPTPVGLPNIKDGIEKNIENNERVTLVNSDFVVINETIYYMVVSSFSDTSFTVSFLPHVLPSRIFHPPKRRRKRSFMFSLSRMIITSQQLKS